MELEELVSRIGELRTDHAGEQALLVGISGIDASGKGFVTDQLRDKLASRGFRTAVINVDGWLNLPHIRFDPDDLPGNFYRNAIRFDEMFERLVIPLRESRSVDIIADLAEETATEYREHHFVFSDIDVILLEGILLFKREFVHHFDLKVWIDSPFDVALERAIARSQEGLSRDETVEAYETIYFTAQRIHFNLDDPCAADISIDN